MFGERKRQSNWMMARQAANSVFSFNGRERNHLFLNQGSRFLDLGATSGADTVGDARSFVAFDADGDGDLDLVVKNLQKRVLHYLRNDVVTDAHRVILRLRGTKGHPDAIGARVELTAGDRTQIREVRSASGFLSQGPRELFFGLGEETQIASLRVLWPGGAEQRFENLTADRIYAIEEGTDAPRPVREMPATNDLRLKADPWPPRNERPAQADTVRPVPPLPEKVAIRRPTLVTFITSWCPSCRADLAWLEAQHGRNDRSFDIVAVHVRHPSLPDNPNLDLSRLPFRVIAGDTKDLMTWRASPGLVVPASFWVTPDGKIRRSYVGRLDKHPILDDLTRLRR